MFLEFLITKNMLAKKLSGFVDRYRFTLGFTAVVNLPRKRLVMVC